MDIYEWKSGQINNAKIKIPTHPNPGGVKGVEAKFPRLRIEDDIEVWGEESVDFKRYLKYYLYVVSNSDITNSFIEFMDKRMTSWIDNWVEKIGGRMGGRLLVNSIV